MENDLQPEGRDYRKAGEIFAKITGLIGGLTLAVLGANAIVKKAGETAPEEHDQDPDTVDLVGDPEPIVDEPEAPEEA